MKRAAFLLLLFTVALPASAECPCAGQNSASGMTPLSDSPLAELIVPYGFEPVGAEVDAKTKLPRRIRHRGTGYELMLVPGGEFRMGSARSIGNFDEHPQHLVRISPFWIGRIEVTNKVFNVAQLSGRPPLPGPDDHPAVKVTWRTAHTWSRLAGMRLPTEAEWEYAAVGTTGRKYPWGNLWKSGAGNFSGRVAAVGTHPRGASPFGILDLAGNAWEWCFDYYDAEYYASSPTLDPQGPQSGTKRVIRGSSLESEMLNSNGVMSRFFGDEAYSSELVGFRAAVSPWRK